MDYYLIIFNALNNPTININIAKTALSVILNKFIYISLRAIIIKRFRKIKRDNVKNTPLSFDTFLK